MAGGGSEGRPALITVEETSGARSGAASHDREHGRSAPAMSKSMSKVAPEPPPSAVRQGSQGSIRRRKTFEPGFDRRQRGSMMQRRSTMLGDLARSVKIALPGTDDQANNNEEEDEDIARTFDALLKRLCDDKITEKAAVEGPMAAWRREYLAGIEDPRLLAFFDDTMPSVVSRLLLLEQNQRLSQKRSVFCTVMLTFFDTISDYCVIVVLFIAGHALATPMLVVLLVSMLTQALCAQFMTNEGPIATVAALIGCKPIVDGINIIFEIPPRATALAPFMVFGITRSIETSTESIPFVIMQALALMTHRSLVQWVSFAISVVNIAYAVASVDYSFDTSATSRAREPTCYGYYPPGAKGSALFASVAIFAFGYVVAKLVAVATLGTVAGASLAFFAASENAGLWLVRFAIGNWRCHNPVGDRAVVSIASHFLVIYPCMVAAPFPLLRHPFFLTPLVYVGFIVWTLFCGNPLMVALAFRHDFSSLSLMPTPLVWVVLGGATSLCVLSALLAFVLMEPTFQDTFYCHRTLATHIRKFCWVRSTTWDGQQIACNEDLDAVRSEVLRYFASAYWPMDLAREWVRTSWAQWLSHPPIWFTEEWQECILDEWASGDWKAEDGSIVVPMTKQEANFRRAIGHTAPWDLNARDFEAYLNDRFVNSDILSPTISEKVKRRELAHQVANGGGVGFLIHCCKCYAESPWLQVSSTATHSPLSADDARVQQLTAFLCEAGLSFYYQLFVASVSESPLHGYEFVRTVQRKPHYELLLVRNRRSEQFAMLTLTASEKIEMTQMKREQKSLSDIQKASEESEFVTSLFHWGASATVVYVIGEYCEGGPLSAHIKPDIGIKDDEEFWRLAFQLAHGVNDIHRTGLTRMDIHVSCHFVQRFILCVPYYVNSRPLTCLQSQIYATTRLVGPD